MGYLVILSPLSPDMSLRGEYKTVSEAVKDAASITNDFMVVKEIKLSVVKRENDEI